VDGASRRRGFAIGAIPVYTNQFLVWNFFSNRPVDSLTSAIFGRLVL
jgi:hypothetical protein